MIYVRGTTYYYWLTYSERHVVRTVQIFHFGDPQVLQLRDTECPTPTGAEVLVAVHAASINGHDTIVRAGGLKIVTGRRFPIGVGLDFAGTVAALGSGADRFAVGDPVWGTVHPQRRHASGGAAEYVVVDQSRLGLAPAGTSSVETASLVVVGTTALTALDDALHLRRGERLLVRGAAGGVGTAAVQLAHARGAHVTALTSARWTDQLLELGADEVLDRSTTDPTTVGSFDAILDTVGTQLGAYRRTLAKGGRMVTVAISGPALAAIAWSSLHGSRRIRTFSANPDTALLDRLAAHVDAGQLRAVVAGTYPLADVADAHRAFEHGGNLGKLVLTVPGPTA